MSAGTLISSVPKYPAGTLTKYIFLLAFVQFGIEKKTSKRKLYLTRIPISRRSPGV